MNDTATTHAPFTFWAEPHGSYEGKFLSCYVEASGQVRKIGPKDTEAEALMYAKRDADYCREAFEQAEAYKAKAASDKARQKASDAKRAAKLLAEVAADPSLVKVGARIAITGTIIKAELLHVSAPSVGQWGWARYSRDREAYGYQLRVRVQATDGRIYWFKCPTVELVISKGILAYGDLGGHTDWYSEQSAAADLEKARNFVPQTLKAGVYANVKAGDQVTVIGTVSYVDLRDKSLVLNRILKTA